jgi:hypothetical protein
MRPEELEALTAGFDDPDLLERSTPLTREQAATWKRIRRRAGRPRIGRGVRVISVSVERGLLARTDRLAKKLRVSRARLVAAGLERILVAHTTREARKPRRRRAA